MSLMVLVQRTFAECLPLHAPVESAREQIGKTVLYDPGYAVLAYPNGDVPSDRRVCTDVIIRAMRSAFGYDLQKAVHEDMALNFSESPQNWGLDHPDKNIGHRRVPNLQTFFERQGWSLEVSTGASDYAPGDIVTCTVSARQVTTYCSFRQFKGLSLYF